MLTIIQLFATNGNEGDVDDEEEHQQANVLQRRKQEHRKKLMHARFRLSLKTKDTRLASRFIGGLGAVPGAVDRPSSMPPKAPH